MNERFIAKDVDEARSLVLSRRYQIFTLFYGESKYKSYGIDAYLSAYLTTYHVYRNSEDFDNVVRAEGISIEWNGTDFGLKNDELIVTKIK